MNILRKKTAMKWIVNIVLLFTISLAFYATRPMKTTKTLLVPQGSITHIIAQLNKQGYHLSVIDKYFLVLMGQPQSGWVDMGTTKLNRIDFLYKLTTAKAKMEKITLIPGETKYFFLEALAKKMHLDASTLNRYYDQNASYPEAAIYADTYFVPYGMSEKQLMHFLLSESEKKYASISNKIYGNYQKKKWLKVLITASIIQKEAANTEEMPLVSSVIYNRLKRGMRLQMDGTLNYGKYSHMKITHERIQNDMTRFNTYKHKGLPSSPIGSVSLASILAAIKPAKTTYLYFMKNEEGVHDFSDNYKTHRQNIQRAR